MIYQKIAETIEGVLGGDYLVSYSNNHDTNWSEILKEAKDKIKYCVLRVDSGTTTQVSDRAVRVEQLRLMVAIPEARDIFNKAVQELRGLLVALNGQTITDSTITALLYAGDYHDAQGTTVNGTRWWVAEVTFLANFYEGIYDSKDVSVSFLKIGDTTTYDIEGIISVNYSFNRVVDSFVYASSGYPNMEQKNVVNSYTKQLTVSVIYLADKSFLTQLLSDEDIEREYTITYVNGAKTRTLNNMILANINENIISGDLVKGTFTFITGE